MTTERDLLDEVGALVSSLRGLGLQPVLVGGMALVILGSRRVTRDFDFVIRDPTANAAPLLDVLYRLGLELASRINDEGDILTTIENQTVAAARIRIDRPRSAYFFNAKSRLRVDLLFDFPLPADALAERATSMTIRSHRFAIASERDLLELKTIARRARSFAGDAQDIEFLERRLDRSK